jgi:hypothetical protein
MALKRPPGGIRRSPRSLIYIANPRIQKTAFGGGYCHQLSIVEVDRLRVDPCSPLVTGLDTVQNSQMIPPIRPDGDANAQARLLHRLLCNFRGQSASISSNLRSTLPGMH